MFAYRQRMATSFGSARPEEQPEIVRLIADEQIWDFVVLHDEIERLPRANRDDVFSWRLQEVIEWTPSKSNTPAWSRSHDRMNKIRDLLSLARGLRNAFAHAIRSAI